MAMYPTQSYIPYGYQMPQMPMAQPQQGQQDIVWVQGEAGAKSYMVAPGRTVPLWDSENQVIYLKSADQCGMPSMRILDYTERIQGARQVPAAAQAAAEIRREEFDQLMARVARLEGGAQHAEPTV